MKATRIPAYPGWPAQVAADVGGQPMRQGLMKVAGQRQLGERRRAIGQPQTETQARFQAQASGMFRDDALEREQGADIERRQMLFDIRLILFLQGDEGLTAFGVKAQQTAGFITERLEFDPRHAAGAAFVHRLAIQLAVRIEVGIEGGLQGHPAMEKPKANIIGEIIERANPAAFGDAAALSGDAAVLKRNFNCERWPSPKRRTPCPGRYSKPPPM